MTLQGFILYLTGSWKFLLLLNVGEMMFSKANPRRANFIIRTLLSVLAEFVLAIPITLGYYAIAATYDSALFTNVAAVTAYLLMFLSSLMMLWICYDCKFIDLLFYGIAGYTLQHICYNAYAIVNTTPIFMDIFYEYGLTKGSVIVNGIELLMDGAVIAIIWLLFAPRSNKSVADTQAGGITVMSIGTLAIVLGVNAVRNIYASESKALSVLCSILLICCCVFILFLRSEMIERWQLKQEAITNERLHKEELKRYEQLNENMALVNIKCHDIKHYIDLAKEKDKIDYDELKNLVRIYESEIKTGNETLDILLSQRSLYCSSLGIILTVFADGEALKFMSATDICSLFGNILENAVEASQKLEDESKRVISLNVKRIAGQLSICEENYFAGEMTFKDGLPCTDKDDKNWHGFGMRSIRMVVEKYGGSMSCSAQDDLFRLSLLIPIKSENWQNLRIGQ